MLDAIQEIFFSLRQNLLRTFLTAFGVFWGIFMLVLLMGAGNGLQRAAERNFSSDLQTSIWINGLKTSIPYKGLAHGRELQFVESDLIALRQSVPQIDLLAAENPLGSARRADIQVRYGNRSASFGVLGVGANYFQIKPYQDYRKGRRLNALDDTETRKVAVIGTKVEEVLFKNIDPLGKLIEVNGVNFTVVGVFYDAGWEGRMSERLYIPLSTFQKTFGIGENIELIAVTPQKGVSGASIIPSIEQTLRQRHNIAPNDRRAFQIMDLAESSAEMMQTMNAISIFIWFVGLGTLAAGIVGISNIMIITVKERTVEIGIRKALGAPPFAIISTILLEALLVTVVAGYFGLVLAVGILEGVSSIMVNFKIQAKFFAEPSVDFNMALSALTVLVTSGAIAGFFPAWNAARISPVAAMRAK